jgi:DNA-binding PadR family transcriptional regulator
MSDVEPQLTIQTLKVLGALMSRWQGEFSGAEIARNTHLASGTLYPILLRLEQAGWAESQWEAGDPRKLGRPRRRLYKLTGVGASRARAALQEMKVLTLGALAWS